jgi:predicted enzyme related to lactoylglutathione lyase
MPNNIAHFAIDADNVPRARRFYEAVFGWRFTPWGPPEVRAQGGHITMEPFVIVGVGTLIYIEDTEGNRVGAMRYDQKAGVVE